MQAFTGICPPEAPPFPTHVQWTGDNRFLSPPEVAAIRAHCDAQTLAPGTIGNATSNPADAKRQDAYRRVDNVAITEMDWLYERVLQKVKLANDAHYRFTLAGLTEPIGYLKYTAAADENDTPGHYDWHQDFGGGLYATRKLSIVVQLSEPSEYEGCKLNLCNDGPWEVPYVQAGDAIMFPSWTPHCVTNIEKGVRRALVIWVAGKQFT